MVWHCLRWTACSLLLGGALAAGGPVHADVLMNQDPRGDVTYYDTTNGMDEALPGTVVPARRNVDLTRFAVRYGQDRIRVVMKFRDLNRREPILMLQGRFRWPAHGQLNYAEAVVTARATNRAGKARMTAGLSCSVRHRISYARNQAIFWFPAICFGTPRWVQFNALVLTTDSLQSPSYVYADDVFSVFGPDGEVERYSKRIPRP